MWYIKIISGLIMHKMCGPRAHNVFSFCLNYDSKIESC